MTQHENSNWSRGMACLGFTLLTWSFGPVFSSKVLTHPMVSAAFRMTFAALLHWLLVTALRTRPTRDLLRRTAIPGALFCLNSILFFAAVQRSSVTSAILLVSLQPVVVLLAAKPLFGEDVRVWDFVWTAVALAGAAYAIVGANSGGRTKRTTPLGVVFALSAMFVFSAYFLIAKRENSHRERISPNPLAFMTAVLTAASVTSWPFLILSGHLHEALHLSQNQITPLVLVVCVPSLGHISMTYAHRHVDASLSSLILLIQPVSTSLAAWWLLSQPIVAPQIVGGFVLLVAIAMVTFGRRRNAVLVSPPEPVEQQVATR